MAKLQLILSEDNQPFHELGEDRTTVGRIEGNALQIDDGSVSSHHAEIFIEDGLYHVRDLESTNGTFVNGEQVTNAVLHDNDEIRFGAVVAIFSTGLEASLDAQPMPESSAPAAQIASQSARPDGFKSTSPVPRNEVKKDPVALAALILGGLALAAAAVAAALSLTAQV